MKISTLIKKILPYFYLIIYLISTALILFKSAETGNVSAKQSSSFAEYLQNNVIGMDKIAEKSEDFPTLIRKFFGHYGLFAFNGFFAILTLFSFLKTSTLPIIISVILGVIVAVLSELIQGATDGRTLSSTDAILNVQGYLSGVAVALILCLFFSFKRTENFKNSVTSYIIFLTASILSIIIYFIFSSKSESVEFCTCVEFFVVSLWIIIEGSYLVYKRIKN